MKPSDAIKVDQKQSDAVTIQWQSLRYGQKGLYLFCIRWAPWLGNSGQKKDRPSIVHDHIEISSQ